MTDQAQANSMTLDDRLLAFVTGYELGLAYRCHLDTDQAEHDASHALVKPIIRAMVADMNRRGPGDHAQIQQRIHDRQVALGEANRANEVPWPAEAGDCA